MKILLFIGKVIDVKKLLATHLIPNEHLLRMDKQRYFGEGLEKGIFSEKFNPLINMLNSIDNNNQENQFLLRNNLNNNPSNITNTSFNEDANTNYNLDEMAEKYKNYFKVLQEDLGKSLERNKVYSKEISDIEEERNYYMNRVYEPSIRYSWANFTLRNIKIFIYKVI